MNIAIMYHYVREPEEWKGSVPISPKTFEKQIDRLGKTHEFVIPDDLEKKTLKPKCIITFDDATKDQYENAFDIMQKKGVPGYFTVMSGPLVEKEVPVMHLVHAALSVLNEESLWDQLLSQLSDKELQNLQLANQIYAYEHSQLRRYIKYSLNYLLDFNVSKNFLERMVYERFGSKNKFIDDMYINVDEFKKMSQAGMTIGVHCVHHAPFKGDADSYYKDEIMPCAEFLKEQLDIEPKWYTPPFGGGEKKLEMMRTLKDVLESAGYKGAFTTNSGLIENTKTFWLNRFDCNSIPSNIFS